MNGTSKLLLVVAYFCMKRNLSCNLSSSKARAESYELTVIGHCCMKIANQCWCEKVEKENDEKQRTTSFLKAKLCEVSLRNIYVCMFKDMSIQEYTLKSNTVSLSNNSHFNKLIFSIIVVVMHFFISMIFVHMLSLSKTGFTKF